ncbi:MAG: hypothetical protein ACT4PU_09715 [Planctomycetota bacterium]
MVRLAAGVIALIVLSNLPQARLPLMLVGLEALITSLPYASSDGQFDDVEVQAKGRTFEYVVARFVEHKQRSGHGDLILFRSFQRDAWRFWNWYDYLTHPRWELPYRAPPGG